MKTQLLEDIGQSAELSLTPAVEVKPPAPGKAEPGLAVAAKAWSAARLAAGGVWRQKPADEPLASGPQEPVAVAPAPELREVFDEIAALEAQFVAPLPQAAPAVAPAEVPQAPPVAPNERSPDPVLAPGETTLVRDPTRPAAAQQEPFLDVTLPSPTSPAHPPHAPAIRPVEGATLGWSPAPAETAPHDPLFDFAPPTTPQAEADPFTPAGAGRMRSPRRYLLWGACLLAGALLIQGGRWLYQERVDSGSLALIAGLAKEVARADQAVRQPAVAAAESAPQPDAGARLPPLPAASSPAPALPPLVMLKPEEYAPRRVEAPPPVAKQVEAAPPRAKPAAKPEPKPKLEPKPKPERAAKQQVATALPKPPIRKAQAPARKAAEPATEKPKREPLRQVARASAAAPEKLAGPDTSTDALLKACREHGYHAAQCIKRGCSVTQYGFACRGR